MYVKKKASRMNRRSSIDSFSLASEAAAWIERLLATAAADVSLAALCAG